MCVYSLYNTFPSVELAQSTSKANHMRFDTATDPSRRSRIMSLSHLMIDKTIEVVALLVSTKIERTIV